MLVHIWLSTLNLWTTIHLAHLGWKYAVWDVLVFRFKTWKLNSKWNWVKYYIGNSAVPFMNRRPAGWIQLNYLASWWLGRNAVFLFGVWQKRANAQETERSWAWGRLGWTDPPSWTAYFRIIQLSFTSKSMLLGPPVCINTDLTIVCSWIMIWNMITGRVLCNRAHTVTTTFFA